MMVLWQPFYPVSECSAVKSLNEKTVVCFAFYGDVVALQFRRFAVLVYWRSSGSVGFTNAHNHMCMATDDQVLSYYESCNIPFICCLFPDLPDDESPTLANCPADIVIEAFNGTVLTSVNWTEPTSGDNDRVISELRTFPQGRPFPWATPLSLTRWRTPREITSPVPLTFRFLVS